MKPTWQEAVSEMSSALAGVEFTSAAGEAMTPDEGFELWRNLSVSLRAQRGTIYLIGNGASASMASHMAADLAKNGHLHTQVFSDLSLITAVANDISYDQVFAVPLETRGRAGDMLVAISSSGASKNILEAVRVARRLDMTIITLSAMAAKNPLRQSGNLNVYVRAGTYGLAESCHSTLLHRWMDMVAIAQH